MNNEFKGKEETEPICAPLIRLEATVRAEMGAPSTNEVREADLDQTEPCAFAPMIRLQSQNDEQTEIGNGNAQR